MITPQGIKLKYSKHLSEGNAFKFRLIGENTTQAVWIPAKHVDKNKQLIGNLAWFWNRPSNARKVKIALGLTKANWMY